MSSVSVLVDDAEKIAAELVPSTALLAPVVGVLVKHVEALVGHELTSLEDSALGVAPPPEPPAPPTPDDGLSERITELEAQLAEAQAQAKAAQS